MERGYCNGSGLGWDCDWSAWGSGYCYYHYQQYCRGASFKWIPIRPVSCSRPDCAEQVRSGLTKVSEFCEKHCGYGGAGKKFRVERAKKFVDQLKQVPCADCGNTFPPVVMDFDHVVPGTKRAEVNRLVTQGATRYRIRAEISVCEIVCSNCHRIRTQVRRLELVA